ncbi:hypothetical protein Dimus_002553 [Dionaea muscipula]
MLQQQGNVHLHYAAAASSVKPTISKQQWQPTNASERLATSSTDSRSSECDSIHEAAAAAQHAALKQPLNSKGKARNKMPIKYKLVDPDEVIDPTTLNGSQLSDEEHDENASENSETSSDLSLEPSRNRGRTGIGAAHANALAYHSTSKHANTPKHVHAVAQRLNHIALRLVAKKFQRADPRRRNAQFPERPKSSWAFNVQGNALALSATSCPTITSNR